MKNRIVSLCAVLLLSIPSVGAQKYYDAVVEDAYGHVKMIKSGDEVYTYDFDGRLISVNNQAVQDTGKYSPDGYLLERCDQLCTEYQYDELNGLLVFENDVALLGEMTTMYKYNSAAERIEKSVFYNNSTLLSVDNYRILRYDDEGNWVEREVRHRSVNSKTGLLEEDGVEKETRVILYYGESDDREALVVDYTKYIDKSFPLTVAMMLERPLGVVNTRQISFSVLQGVALTTPSLFTNVRTDKNFSGQPTLFANVQFPYADYVVDYVSVSCVDEKSDSVKSVQFHVKTEAKNVKNVAEQMCLELNMLGIEMKKHKWGMSVGYQGYWEGHTIGIMYSKKEASGVTLLVTFDAHLK